MLKEICSKTGLFDSVKFNSGLNIIVGKYSGNRENSNINGIGKSSLIRMINFCLVSESAEKLFLKSHYDFLRKGDHSVTLDFEAGNKDYRVTRTFNKNDGVFLQIDGSGRMYGKSDMRSILTNVFFPTRDENCLIEGDRFGTLLRFFIKDDLSHSTRVDPAKIFEFKKKSELAIYNFYLYGIKNVEIHNFEKNGSEYRESYKQAKSIEKRVEKETNKKIGKLKTERVKFEKEIERLKNSIDKYKFIDNYKIVEDDILRLTRGIGECLKNHLRIESRRDRLAESYRQNINIDTNKVGRIYNEIREGLGDVVSKKLEEAIEFKNEILENRKRYILNRDKELQKESADIENKIRAMESERSGKYRLLNEKGSLDSVKNTYETYMDRKNRLNSYAGDLSRYDDCLRIQAAKKEDIGKDKNEMVKSLDLFKGKIDDLRSLFLEILENAIFVNEDPENSFFDISLKSKNRTQDLPFDIAVEVPKADALGQSKLKIVAYDLMVYLNSMRDQRGFPRFLVHDGVFHGIFTKTVVNTLNYMHRKLLEHPGFQYILTFNEDEISLSDKRYGEFEFDIAEKIVKEYSDKEEGMLFKMNF